VADADQLAFDQFSGADNMTDRQGALTTLVNGTSPLREQALDAFYQRYSGQRAGARQMVPDAGAVGARRTPPKSSRGWSRTPTSLCPTPIARAR
jgi:hypothetical protein